MKDVDIHIVIDEISSKLDKAFNKGLKAKDSNEDCLSMSLKNEMIQSIMHVCMTRLQLSYPKYPLFLYKKEKGLYIRATPCEYYLRCNQGPQGGVSVKDNGDDIRIPFTHLILRGCKEATPAEIEEYFK